jgi:hypothetical protein
MLTIERRQPTPAERAVAFPKKSAKRRADDIAWCVAPVFGLAVIGWLLQLVIQAIGWKVAPWPVVIGAALGLPLTVLLTRGYLRHRREQRDRTLDVVEVLRVTAAQYVEMEEHNDEGPHYFIQAAPTKVLFLSGQWMFYGDVLDADDDQEFPSVDFELVWDPVDGQALRLSPSGAKAPLVQSYRIDELLSDAGDFPIGERIALFEGDISDVPKALAAASGSRARPR